MAASMVGIRVRGEGKLIEALGGVSREADFAQRSAMRAARTKARSLTVKAITKETPGVVQKVWRSRVQAYDKTRRSALAVAKLWLGLKAEPRAATHPSVLRALRLLHPAGFLLASGAGLPRWMTRAAGQLTEHRLRPPSKAESILQASAREALTDVYPRRLKAEFLRRVKRSARRALT